MSWRLHCARGAVVQLGSLDRAQDRAQDGAQGAGWTGRKGQRDLRAYDAVARRLLEAPWRTSPGGPGAHHPEASALAHITRIVPLDIRRW